jgi:hypothetical protein
MWLILSQWVWNLRLELGQLLHRTAMRTTEFASAVVSTEPTCSSPLAATASYGPPTFAKTWKQGRMSGQDFIPQPDGTLRCPAGTPLYPQERRPERDGTVRVVYAARISHCRACLLREQCQWHGNSTKKPRRVSAVLHPLIEPPKLAQVPQAALASGPILWGDWPRRSPRRQLVKLLRQQRVEIRSAQPSPSAQPPPAQPLSRAQLAHYRLSWKERLARNAAASTSPCVSITLFGVPDAFAEAIGLKTR